jgi:hypothetical protein
MLKTGGSVAAKLMFATAVALGLFTQAITGLELTSNPN